MEINAYKLDKETRKETRVLTGNIAERMRLIRELEDGNQVDIESFISLKKKLVNAFIELSETKPEVRPKSNIQLVLAECKDPKYVYHVGCMIVWFKREYSGTDNVLTELAQDMTISNGVVLSKKMKQQDKAVFIKYFNELQPIFYKDRNIKSFLFELGHFVSKIKIEMGAMGALIKTNTLDQASQRSLKNSFNGVNKLHTIATSSLEFWMNKVRSIE